MLRNLLNRLLPGRAPGAVISGAAALTANADRWIAAGDAAETAGDLRKASELYRKAVDAAPAYAKARLSLGVALEAIGDTDGAIQSYEEALAIDPANPLASYNLGRMHYMRGALHDAKALLHRALEHKPHFPEAYVVLSNLYDAEDNPGAAAEALEIALKQRPDWPGALFNYGMMLKKLGRLSEAESALSRVVAIDPGNTDASHELANLLHARGALQEAETLLRLAIKRQPLLWEAHDRLFQVLSQQGNSQAAAAAAQAAAELLRDSAGALKNYGLALRRLGRLAEAEAALRRAIIIAPQMARAYWELGVVLHGQSRIAECLKALSVARRLEPEAFDLESGELLALTFSDEIPSEDLFAKHRAFGVRLENAYPPRFEPFQNNRDPERRLRIGYVSGDFYRHPVALFTAPLFERHDRKAYEIYCYSVGARVESNPMKGLVDHWREAASMSHAELAETINSDSIDILVDLSGHSGQSRLAVIAQQPAPVQVSWLGYLNTTGTTRIQYRLCDRHSDPPGLADPFHTESLYRLPHSQWCYRPLISVDGSNTLPFRLNGYITFGSFNQVTKLSPSIRGLWADILRRLPNSRLLIAGVPEGHTQDILLEYFENCGIGRTRIAVAPRVALQDYFRLFDSVDMALDSAPYSGGTTSCDALWMGVPVLTVPGSRSVSRSTASILSTVGLGEWIASSPEDYVQRALRFAAEDARLAELRQTLRQRMRESPLMDEFRFARDIEDAYRHMWRAWCVSTD